MAEQSIEENARETMDGLMAVLDREFNSYHGVPNRAKVGLVLFCFTIGDDTRDYHAANVDQKEVVATLKKFLARLDGQTIEPGRA
jgi:hypothetical protein